MIMNFTIIEMIERTWGEILTIRMILQLNHDQILKITTTIRTTIIIIKVIVKETLITICKEIEIIIKIEIPSKRKGNITTTIITITISKMRIEGNSLEIIKTITRI